MSDEYSGNNRIQGSLVDGTAAEAVLNASDYATRNYPPENDSTSSGGYRGGSEATQPTVIDQPPSGGPIGDELQDARQGSDRAVGSTPSGEANSYGSQSFETRGQAEDMLASRARKDA